MQQSGTKLSKAAQAADSIYSNKRMLKKLRATLVKLLASLDSEVGYRLAHSVHYGQPIDLSIKPEFYSDPCLLRKDLQALSLVSKNPWAYDADEAVLKQNALETFLSCEEQCRLTNDNLSYRMVSLDPFTKQVLDYAKYICYKILGPYKLEHLDFSPGANVGIKGSEVNLIDKLKYYPVCTPKAYTTVMWNVLHFLPLYAISSGIITRDRTDLVFNAELPRVKGNNYTTVPKDWKKLRPICIEPLGNMLVQKGIGSAIKSRLKKFGLDISTAQKLHGELARLGSIDDSLSTIDLKSASDTISYELVKYILPSEWFSHLDAVRSQFTNIGGSGVGETWIENEKFSSMGNGYTFELETLLFYCLCLGVRRYAGQPSMVVRVYGDDIIVSKPISELTVCVLEDLGFTINLEKTFLSGPFKESCGFDYWKGIPVRPVYLTSEAPASDSSVDVWLAFLYGLANRIVEVSDHLSDHPDFLDESQKKSWSRIVDMIPRKLRCFGPSGLGDIVLIGKSWELRTIPVDRQERLDCLQNKHTVSRSTWCQHLRVMVRRSGKRSLPDEHNHLLSCILAGISPDGVEVRNSKFTFRPTWITLYGVEMAKKYTNPFDKRMRNTGKVWL